MDFYRECRIRFMNIQNIHVMRESFQKLTKACNRTIDPMQFVAEVTASGWLFHLSEILKATFSMVLALDRDKLSILSHCSDGWDRTSQLVALAQLCLDPYYRTIEGFCILIEKDWLSFGHRFSQRLGHRDKNCTDEQRAPIFLQWLDAVYQLTIQFPRHFQFNSKFLLTILDHQYSCRFGTFFFNTERRRESVGLKKKTTSLWTYVLGSPAALRGEFLNPLYSVTGFGIDQDERSEERFSRNAETDLVCRLLLEKKKTNTYAVFR
eukprot:TRINITY_DN29427_c0_g1_i5.p1 TRINITY_DN29427_c0_g1~~TRINITY_DN29427_c0_g1_i5.p1  ORF type:complete len:310 (-),score=49.11 TRINITY_DN29427_c0_g1_i5:12-806(-)